MKRLSASLLFVFCVCLFLLAPTSCLKEDLSDCPPPEPVPAKVSYRLGFTYVPLSADKSEGFDPSELETLTVYAFDSLGCFVASATDEAPRLGETDFNLAFTLPEGLYDFYAWGNVRDCYRFDCAGFEPGKTNYETIRLLYEGAVQDTVSAIPPPLFFSSLCDCRLRASSVSRSAGADISLSDTLFIVKDRYTLCFEATGLDEEEGAYRAVLTDDNACYGFDNSFASSKKLHYTALFGYKEAESAYCAELGCLRLSRERRPEFKLYDTRTGELLYQDCLTDLLLAGETAERKVDFTRMYDFVIRLDFTRETETGIIQKVRIRVNDWAVVEKDVTIDLGKPNLPYNGK